GAAYYGCTRHGAGLRIGGGIGRSYYVGVETASAANALCLVPQGTEEGQTLELPQTFTLRVATPVGFPLFSSSVRASDTLGALVAQSSEDLVPLPPLETTLATGRHAVKKTAAVRLRATLTATGTLALRLKSTD